MEVLVKVNVIDQTLSTYFLYYFQEKYLLTAWVKHIERVKPHFSEAFNNVNGELTRRGVLIEVMLFASW